MPPPRKLSTARPEPGADPLDEIAGQAAVGGPAVMPAAAPVRQGPFSWDENPELYTEISVGINAEWRMKVDKMVRHLQKETGIRKKQIIEEALVEYLPRRFKELGIEIDEGELRASLVKGWK